MFVNCLTNGLRKLGVIIFFRPLFYFPAMVIIFVFAMIKGVFVFALNIHIIITSERFWSGWQVRFNGCFMVPAIVLEFYIKYFVSHENNFVDTYSVATAGLKASGLYIGVIA